jgi:hypothetical protein
MRPVVTSVVQGKPITAEQGIVGLAGIRDGEFYVEIPANCCVSPKAAGDRAAQRPRAGQIPVATLMQEPRQRGQRKERPKTRDSGGGVPVPGAVAPDALCGCSWIRPPSRS